MVQQNLTDPLDIKHALERKLGYGAIKKIADKCAVSLPTASNALAGRRRNTTVLTYAAKMIGQPVHGVTPDGTELAKTC